jgi:hypothetical protein
MLSEKEPPDKIKRWETDFIKWRHRMEFTTEELMPIAEHMAALCIKKLDMEKQANHGTGRRRNVQKPQMN